MCTIIILLNFFLSKDCTAIYKRNKSKKVSFYSFERVNYRNDTLKYGKTSVDILNVLRKSVYVDTLGKVYSKLHLPDLHEFLGVNFNDNKKFRNSDTVLFKKYLNKCITQIYQSGDDKIAMKLYINTFDYNNRACDFIFYFDKSTGLYLGYQPLFKNPNTKH